MTLYSPSRNPWGNVDFNTPFLPSNPMGGMAQTAPAPMGMSTSPVTNAMDPLTLALGLGSIGQGIFGGLLGNSASKRQERIAREQMQMQRQLAAAQMGAQTAGLAPAMERQRVALAHALLSGMRPSQVQAPAHLSGSVPNVQAAFRIPEGGFSPETLGFLAPGAMRAQESAFQGSLRGIDPKAMPPALSQVGYGDALRRGIAGDIARPRRSRMRMDEAV